MANAIFRKGLTTKGGIYDVIKNELLSAGWENISSNPINPYGSNLLTNDGDMFYSPSKTGDRKLLLNMRPFNANLGQDTRVTAYGICSIRMPIDYEPAEEQGKNGIFTGSQTWSIFELHSNVKSILYDSTVKYTIYADLNRVIIGLEYHRSYGHGPVVHYFGMPDEEDLLAPFSGNKGVLMGSSIRFNGGTVANNVLVANNPDGMVSTVPANVGVAGNLNYADPTLLGNKMLGLLVHGSATQSYRGYISDIYLVLRDGNIKTGDLIDVPQDDGSKHTFYVLEQEIVGGCSFVATTCICLRIA